VLAVVDRGTANLAVLAALHNVRSMLQTFLQSLSLSATLAAVATTQVVVAVVTPHPSETTALPREDMVQTVVNSTRVESVVTDLVDR
tara:strand:+ start:137 stop:397 length:261 start_codon:yes stop_codon:yes gene_type:complete